MRLSEIAFNGSKSSTPDDTALTYAWNFGDGATGSGVSPSHTYTSPDTYTVSLTVTDTRGGTNEATTNATIVPACTSTLLGDVNSDGVLTDADADMIQAWLAGTLAALTCPANADANQDGVD